MSSIKDLEETIKNLTSIKTAKEKEIERIVALIDKAYAEKHRIEAENLPIKAGNKLIPKGKCGGCDFVVEEVCSEDKIHIKWYYHCIQRDTFTFDYLMEHFDVAS